MARPKISNLLMWVGASDYPTVTSFVSEAERLGVSKCVAQVPIGVKLNRSLLFLAHDEAVRITCTSCEGRGIEKGKLNIELVKRNGRSWESVLKPSKRGVVAIRRSVATAEAFRKARDSTYRKSDRKHKWRVVVGQKMCGSCRGRGESPAGRIFGFCVVQRLELVFDCASAAKEYKERREVLRKRDRVPLTYVSGVDKEPRRRCGYRRIGGHYLVAGDDAASINARTLAAGLGVGFKARGPLVVFPDPIAYPGSRFRAAKVVGKECILKAAKAAAVRLNRALKRYRRTKKRAR